MATITTSAHGKIALAVARDRILAELKARHGAGWDNQSGPLQHSALAHWLPTDAEAATFVTALTTAGL